MSLAFVWDRERSNSHQIFLTLKKQSATVRVGGMGRPLGWDAHTLISRNDQINVFPNSLPFCVDESNMSNDMWLRMISSVFAVNQII